MRRAEGAFPVPRCPLHLASTLSPGTVIGSAQINPFKKVPLYLNLFQKTFTLQGTGHGAERPTMLERPSLPTGDPLS